MKKVRDRDGQDRNVRETAFYLLTHSGIWVDELGKQIGQAYVYFGEYSTNAGGRIKVGTVDEVQPCEKCKSGLVKWQIENPDPDEPTLELKNGRCEPINNHYLERWASHLDGGWCCEDYVITKNVYEYRLSKRALSHCHRQLETENQDLDNVRIELDANGQQKEWNDKQRQRWEQRFDSKPIVCEDGYGDVQETVKADGTVEYV